MPTTMSVAPEKTIGRNRSRLATTVAPLIALAACADASDTLEAGDACDGSEYITWDGTTLTEAPPGPDSELECDPMVGGVAYYEGENIFGTQLETFAPVAEWGKNPNIAVNIVAFRIGVVGEELAAGVAYPIAPEGAQFSVMDTDATGTFRYCKAATGTTTISTLGEIGDATTGSYAITSWEVNSDATCPSASEANPVSGTFSVVRGN